MDKSNQKNNTQTIIDQNTKTDQYTVSGIPFHKHNGIDSPKIKATDIFGGKYLLTGLAQMIAGTVTITDPRITISSVIVATPQGSAVGANFAAICNKGNAVIFESTGARTDIVNYIIAL